MLQAASRYSAAVVAPCCSRCVMTEKYDLICKSIKPLF